MAENRTAAHAVQDIPAGSAYDGLFKALTRRLCEVDKERGESWAREMILGHPEGVKAIEDACRTKAPQGQFSYGDRRYSHQRLAKEYLDQLPGVLEELHLDEDAARARSIIKANLHNVAKARAEIVRLLSSNGAEILAALISCQRKRSADMLTKPAPYRYFSTADHVAFDLSLAADHLAAAVEADLKLGRFSEDRAKELARALGYTAGAGREALRQAALAFDHESFEEKQSQRENRYFDLSLLAASLPASILGCMCTDLILDQCESALLATLGFTCTSTVTIVMVMILLLGLRMLLRTPDPVKKANLIAGEASELTRSLNPESKVSPVRRPAAGHVNVRKLSHASGPVTV